MLHAQIKATIRERKQELAQDITAQHYKDHPQLHQQHGEEGRAKCRQDVGHHLTYLSEAIGLEQPELFAHYIAWVKIVLEKRGMPSQILADNLHYLHDALLAALPAEMHDIITAHLEAGLDTLAKSGEEHSYLSPEAPHHTLARDYLHALLNGERHAASLMIQKSVTSGIPVKEIYLHVFQPVQYEIGRLWQINEISVAEEHYATAVTQLIMSQLYPEIFATERNGHTLVATCVGGELHEIGVRMVADFFEMAGWDTFYLGANTPSDSIIYTLQERNAEILAISVTLASHIDQMTQLIQTIRRSDAGEVKILVGGYPFNQAPQLWKKIGADGYGASADEAIAVSERLVGNGH
ncbi:MAG: cobalamin B12-binding domain protein [Chloroflexi bacterium]|jgi:methanogenic corrinoid protein MtbC1|nr:cobalamin B12-binding domain protein [Chloroflexota bacterium]